MIETPETMRLLNGIYANNPTFEPYSEREITQAAACDQGAHLDFQLWDGCVMTVECVLCGREQQWAPGHVWTGM